MASKKDDPEILIKLKDQHSKDLQNHVDKISEMMAVMKRAIEIDEQFGSQDCDRILKLEQENRGLREILQITRESFLNLRKEEAQENPSLSVLVHSNDHNLRKSWASRTKIKFFFLGEAQTKSQEMDFPAPSGTLENWHFLCSETTPCTVMIFRTEMLFYYLR